jgi:triacylglycerol esterase/lipase EstA (alpha/beta hydrolase family)
MARQARTLSQKRFHIVLLPGFAGFDALGQLEYYGRVTPLFYDLRAPNQVLHYFDNLPTASVTTRASRLQSYLAKRIARGEISDGDEVTLVGHSTGGLDIRRLLCDLHQLDQSKQVIAVDGGAKVKPRTIIKLLRRVVFLSVPHWGTNIADWVHSHDVWRLVLIENLRAAVEGSKWMFLDWIETSFAAGLARITDADLARAAQDALSEANEYNGRLGPVRTADAFEAASELALYLRQMASDFSAIDDLTSCPRVEDEHVSPAHFSVDEREEELELADRIKFLSYETIGNRARLFGSGEHLPMWEPTSPLGYLELIRDCVCRDKMDVVYRACYRACAGGPFEEPPMTAEVTRRLDGAPHNKIELWDNDGIVNTLSMFWPRGENVLVAADHMDIVGHYKPLRAKSGEGRTYQTYDLLKSQSGFSERMFKDVWREIFAFSLGRQRHRRAHTAQAA